MGRAGGRALIVGGWVRDRLMGRGLERHRPRSLRPLRAGTTGGAGGIRHGQHRRGELHRLQGCRASTSRCPGANRRRGAATAASRSRAIRELSIAEAARRRDFTINAIAWDPLTGEYLDPLDGRGDLARARAPRGRSAYLRRRQPARAARAAVRRALRLRPRARRRATICRGIALDDLPAERIWGEIEKLLLQAPRPSVGLAARRWSSAWSSDCSPSSRPSSDASRNPSGTPKVTSGCTPCSSSTKRAKRIDDLDRPRQAVVMLGALCHDLGKPSTTAFLDGRIRSMDHEQAGVAPATAVLDRLNVHSIDGYDVRREVLGIVAHHLKPGMFRQAPTPVGGRGVPASRAEGRSRAAGESREIGLPGARRRVRLLGDGLVSRTCARARRPARAA